ncbi:hypothetical protein MMC10_007109 [Thelotrema lepadinum]|nr:hypothetical protein [Thelotrema lepadinum]
MLSSLPAEIIELIFEQIRDVGTLDRLCEATRFTAHLFHLALSQRWEEVQIGEGDFLVAPHVCDRPEHSSAEPRKLLHTLLESPAQGSAPVASYIKILSISLEFEVTPDLYGEPYEDEYSCLEDVTNEDIDHSFSLLFPQLTTLKQLNLDGVLYQGQLERITQLQSIQILRLRRPGGCWPLLRRGHGRFNRGADLCLQWDSLPKLTRLRNLEIGQVVPSEAASLGNAFIQLDGLRKLVVSASGWEGDQESSIEWYGTKPGSLNYFVEVIAGNSTANSSKALLPPSLWSLALNANCYGANFQIRPVQVDTLTPLQAPHELDLGSLGIDSIITVLNFQLLSSLTSLWLPARTLSPKNRQLVSSLRDRLSLLDQISLVGICTSEILSSDILDNFGAEDLTVGAMKENWDKHRSPYDRLLGDFDLDPDLAQEPPQFTLAMPENLWSQTLRRMTVDHIRFVEDDEIFRALTPERWPELRLLVFRPRLGYPVKETIGRREKPCWHLGNVSHYINRWPEAAVTSAECLADRIAERGLPNLRVLVLGTYWFWISRAKESGPRALRFADARGDPVEASSIAESLSKHDWNFLLEMSPTVTLGEDSEVRYWANLNQRESRTNILTLYRKRNHTDEQVDRWRGPPSGRRTTTTYARKKVVHFSNRTETSSTLSVIDLIFGNTQHTSI